MIALGISMAIVMTALSVGSAEAKVKLLGEPCRAKNILAGRCVIDPNSGRELLVLTNQNEATNAELLFVDFAANTGKAYSAPAGAGSWALNEVPGNRLVVGTFFDGTFMVFDLKKMAFVKATKFPGEDYIWNQALGKDGRLYGGTYPGGKLGALDLKTYAVEDLGAPAKPNLYLRNVSALPDGRILCQFMEDKRQTMIFDPDTKAFTPAPAALAAATIGATWNGCFLADSTAYQGADLQPLTPQPFPLPKGETKWTVNTTLTSARVLYFQCGKSLYRYTVNDAEPTFITDADLHGGGFTAASSKGEVLCVRGPDYAVVRPGAHSVDWKTIPVESAPRPTHFLKLDGMGKLWGGPTFGQTVFSLDLKSRDVVNTSKVSNHGGEVFDAAFRGNSMYLVSYAGGEIIRYQTDRPFDQIGGVNPRTIAVVGPKYIRPSGGIVLGPDAKLYSGWMARYGEYGGALAITDPGTGKTEVVADPLGAQTVHGVAVDAKNAYLGTSLQANGLRTKPGESARFGVIDLATRKVIFQHEFRKAEYVHSMGYDAATKRVGMLVDKAVAVYDIAAGALVEGLPPMPVVTSDDGYAPGDGFYYYGSGKSVVAVTLATGVAKIIARLPATVEHLTAAKGGEVIVSCGVRIYLAREASK